MRPQSTQAFPILTPTIRAKLMELARMSAPIDFYFDFASPYGYIASAVIDQLRNGTAAASTGM